MIKTLTKPANVRLVAAIASLILVSALIVRTTQAAFSAQDTNAGNFFETGLLSLEDKTTTSFNASGLKPGDIETHCIDVEYAGDWTGTTDLDTVRFYVSDLTDNGLADALDVTVTLVPGGCGGTAGDSTTATLDLLGDDYATGEVPWTPSASPQTYGYDFSVEVLDVAEPDEDATADFAWEIQTKP